MAMINCPECGNQISTRATACVKCGLPMDAIFICPECGKVELREGKRGCSVCGCPMELDVPVSNIQISREKEKNEQADESEYIAIAEEIIETVLARHSITGAGIISESGFPISNAKKVRAIKIAFKIPEDDNVYFIASGNIMGGINESSKGFAIASHGIYFKDDGNKQGAIYLDRFSQMVISTFITYVKIGSFEFNVGDTKKIKNLLLDLQAEVRSYL